MLRNCYLSMALYLMHSNKFIDHLPPGGSERGGEDVRHVSASIVWGKIVADLDNNLMTWARRIACASDQDLGYKRIAQSAKSVVVFLNNGDSQDR